MCIATEISGLLNKDQKLNLFVYGDVFSLYKSVSLATFDSINVLAYFRRVFFEDLKKVKGEKGTTQGV